jgi:type III secretion protein HrpB1
MVTDTEFRDDVAGGLAKMLWSASQLDNESDFDELLEAIRVLRPRWRGASKVVAWRYLRRREWTDARRVLEDDDPDAKHAPLHAVLMAVCLFGLEDPLWHSFARVAVDQSDDPHAALIGGRLLQRAARNAGDALLEAAAGLRGTGGDESRTSMMWVRA